MPRLSRYYLPSPRETKHLQEEIQLRQKTVTKQIHLNAFEMNCVGHLARGLWKHPANTRSQYTDLDYWTEEAQLLEEGLFDSMFLADVLGTYETAPGDSERALRAAHQVPANDPLLLVPAMGLVTRQLGFAVTISATYEPPYAHARRLTTVDHLTKGRIGWNMVTSYLNNAARNFGLDGQIAHDDRYDRADEYLDVCYKLWEGSWDDGAVIRDRENDTYTDPAKVHYIDHEGTYFRVAGPHLSEPSPQRTPVIFQATASPRGKVFAGKHAEAVFLGSSSLDTVRDDIAEIRRRSVEGGRSPDDVKISTTFGSSPGGPGPRPSARRKTMLSTGPGRRSSLASTWPSTARTSRCATSRSLTTGRAGTGDVSSGSSSKTGPDRDRLRLPIYWPKYEKTAASGRSPSWVRPRRSLTASKSSWPIRTWTGSTCIPT